MAALLLGAAAWGHAAAAPVAPARVQLATWEAGQSLLDGGAATAAGAHYLSLLADGYVLPHVEGALEAANRLCREDSALAALAGRLRGDDARLHLEAARQRAAERHGAAAAAWARLAARASARGDTAGAAIAWLACARARLRAEEPDSARTACARVAVLRLSAAAGGRLRADARTLAAGIAYLAGGHAEADSLYRLALDEAQARGWRQIACDALNGLGAVKSRQRRFAESLAFYARAVDMATALGDSGRAAMCLANLAYQETEARDVAAARGHLARAHKIALACGRPSLLGAVQTGLGAAADAEGRRDAAAEHFRQACDVLVAGGHERGELAARQRLAYVLLQTGEYAQAVSHYERCRLICERLRTPHIRNWVEGGLALACHYLGDLDRAAAAYRRALALNEELGDRMSAAWCLNSLGQLAALQGDYRRALVDHHRALETCAAIDDGAGEARTRVSIAWVHLQLGDLESARDEGERALTLAEAARSEEIAREAMGALQAVYAAAGNPALAELHARRALTIARRWRDKVAMIDALDDLAALHLAQGRRADARRLLADASALLADDGEWPARARTLLLRSRAHGEPDSASALAARALALAREGGLSELEWQCLADLGGLALARGDTAAAERLLTESVTASESLRRRVGVDELRRHLPAPAAAPYESLIALQARRGGRGAPMALATADRARAGVLADRLREALARGGEGPSPESARRERDLVSRLAHVQARLQDGGLDTLTRRDLGQRARDLEREHGLLGLRLAASGAPHARELYAAPESPDSLLAALRPGERLLYYVLGAEGSWLFSATRDAVCAHALPPRDEIETRVDLYLRLRLRGDAPPPVPTMAARGLHDLLVAPAAAELRPGETLVVVPDGLLHRLPFGVLRSADGPLGEGHAVFVAPSLGTLRALRARGAARQEMVDPSPLPLLAVGCEGDRKRGAAARGRVHPFTGAPLPRLHHAEREAAMVADLFPGARLLRDADATEGSGLRALLASAQVVHFAAHGHADDADPRRSYLVLNPPAVAPDAGGADDGLLQWHEAVSLPLRATLVTLASCRSAGGELARGEGVTGLTQAFLHAGADCVLAAQADVPDAAARRLLLAFYRAWRGGLPAAAALQSAQRAALARQDADGWQATGAEFVLVGDGSVMAPGARPARRPPAVATALALTAATAATAVVIAVRRRRRRGRDRRGGDSCVNRAPGRV